MSTTRMQEVQVEKTLVGARNYSTSDSNSFSSSVKAEVGAIKDSCIVTTTPLPQLPPPPDGGFVAWWQCFAAFCIYWNTWGLLNSYGAFQNYYQKHLLSTSTPSQISWIGTVQSFFILFGALWAGPLFDWGYLRALVTVGSAMLVLGTFLTASCTEYYQVLLAQGVLIGLGISCIFVPMPGVLSQYFQQKRSLALGIAAVGSSLSGIVYPIVFNKLVDRIGFGWTVRVIGFIVLVLQMPVVLGFKARVKSASVRRIFDASAWRDVAFVSWCLCYFFAFIGLYIPYFYIQSQAEDDGSVTGSLNFYLLPLLNVGGLFGRLAIGYLGDLTGPINIFIGGLGACVVLLFGWTGVQTRAGVLAFSLVYGFFSGAVVSMTPTCVAVSLCADIRQFGVRWSMISVPWAVGLLVGNPLAGVVLAAGGYQALRLMAASAVLVALCFAVVTRVVKVGWRVSVKI